MTISIVLALFFSIIEFSRALHAYNTARIAASEGAFVAANTLDEGSGEAACRARITQARLGAADCTCFFGGNQHNYTCSSQTEYVAIMCGATLPFPGGTLSNFTPCSFPVEAFQSNFASLK